MKSKKPLQLGLVVAVLLPLLSGCVQRTKSGKPYGIVYDYLAVPGQHVMEWLANMLGHSAQLKPLLPKSSNRHCYHDGVTAMNDSAGNRRLNS